MGAIFSTTVFISLNSIEFCNRHIYSVPQTTPILNLSTFCLLNSFITLLVTCYVHLRTTENPDPELHESVKVVLQHIKCLLYNKHVQTLLIHLLLFRLSFQPIIVSTCNEFLLSYIISQSTANPWGKERDDCLYLDIDDPSRIPHSHNGKQVI